MFGSPRSALPVPAALATAGLVLAATLALLAPTRVEAAPSPEAFDAMCRDVARVAGAEPNVTTGVVIVDLETGDRCAINADRTYRSASLYKTVVAAELWRQVSEGDVDLEQPLTVEPRHHIDDAVDVRPEDPYTLAVYDAAERMITFSDNGTAFALRELLGTGTVNDAAEWLEMPATSLGATFVTSPNDQATLFSALYRGEVVDEASSAAVLELLSRQEINDMIPAGLPEDAEFQVAHKTGTLSGFLHDAGVVYAPGGDFVLVVMTENGSYEAALSTIHSVAGTAFEAYAEPPPPPATPTPEVVAVAVTPVATPASIQSTESTSQPVVFLAEDPAATFVDTLREPVVLAGLLMLTAAVVMAPVALLRRRPAPVSPSPGGGARGGVFGGGANGAAGMGSPDVLHYGDSALSPESVRLRADRSERGLVMRFGSRRDDDGRPSPMSPASRSVSEVSEQPVLPSKRLQRLAEHFRSQGDLLATMRDQFEDEMEPLHELIVKQSQTMHAVLQNLEDRLRPLNEYADGEEANLTALEERIQAGGQDHVARSFSNYLEEQRRRIDETRTQIDEQRMPFLEYGDAQRETVESALSRFDGDLEALEENLAEQRRVMVRMLDAMRSETFSAVKDFLDGRQAVLAELAAQGSTDPVEISRATQKLREGLKELASRSDYVRALLEQAEMSDRALASIAPAPRAIRDEPEMPPMPAADLDEADDDEAEVSA